MKALLISRYILPDVGGSTLVIHELCRRTAEISVLGGSYDPEKEREHDANLPYPVYRGRALAPVGWEAHNGFTRLLRSAHAHLWNRLRTLWAVWRAARKSGAEVVCICSTQFYWLGGFLRRLMGLPLIFYIHGIDSEEESRFVGSRKDEALREAEGVFGVSRFVCEWLKKRGVLADRVRFIPNGVDAEYFTPGEKDATIMDGYGLRGKRVLLTVARFEPCKGHATVLRALPRIVQECPDVVYVLVGSGRGLPDLGLEKLARDAGVEGHVIFAGEVPRDQVRSFYRTCDIFALPNYAQPNGMTEGFGLVFLEASACGKPVIAGRDGGAPDAVLDGETGILVNGASEEEFAAAALRLLKEPEFAARLGRRGVEWAHEMSWDAMAAKFAGLCEEVAAHRGKKRSRSAQAGQS